MAPVDALDLFEKVRTGARTDLVFVSARSTDRWLVQWNKGARLISDYKDESQETIEALADALMQQPPGSACPLGFGRVRSHISREPSGGYPHHDHL